MPTFSIIVPVYNAEKTLYKCLDSLCAQTYEDFEVHLVENGSGDSSRSICREFAQKDPRFQLHVSEQNCGPSGARNIGLDHARGTYIAFLDSDDYVEEAYLRELYQAFENADVVFFGYHQILVDGQFVCDHLPEIQDGSGYYEILLQLLKQDMFGYTWIKAFRREMIGDHRFSRELNLLEDEVFACNVLAKPCRVSVVAKAIHNYITGNSGSLIGRTHPDYCRKVDAAYKAWKTLLERYEKKDEALEQMRDNCDSLRDLAIIDLLASSGMRVGELVALNRDDINFNERECVVFGKGNKERLVYFDARTKIHLQNYLDSRIDGNPALFVTLRAPYNRLQIGCVERRLRQLGRRLSIPKVHPHKFRRTLATMAIDKGMPIEQVQQLLGHQKIDTTMHYAMVKQQNVKLAHRKYIG